MIDLIAIAFQTDQTRGATLILSRDLSGQAYPFPGATLSQYLASHDNYNDKYIRITTRHVSQFAALAARLKAMPEGDRTVLDNSCLMFISNMWFGRMHNNRRLPIVLAGGLGESIRTGRTLHYLNAGDENRKTFSPYLSLLDRVVIKDDHFGDAPLANL